MNCGAPAAALGAGVAGAVLGAGVALGAEGAGAGVVCASAPEIISALTAVAVTNVFNILSSMKGLSRETDVSLPSGQTTRKPCAMFRVQAAEFAGLALLRRAAGPQRRQPF